MVLVPALLLRCWGWGEISFILSSRSAWASQIHLSKGQKESNFMEPRIVRHTLPFTGIYYIRHNCDIVPPWNKSETPWIYIPSARPERSSRNYAVVFCISLCFCFIPLGSKVLIKGPNLAFPRSTSVSAEVIQNEIRTRFVWSFWLNCRDYAHIWRVSSRFACYV